MATGVEKKNFQRYLAEARSWETDKVRALQGSRRTAWIVAGVATVVAAIGMVTVATMVPLHKVEAYVVRVDSVSGTVSTVPRFSDGPDAYDEAISKYFVQWYVRWREGYQPGVAQDFYGNVGILSSPSEQRRYLKWYDPRNSASPLNLYKNYGRSTITVTNTTFMGKGTALVNFTKEEDFGKSDQNADSQIKVTKWKAIVHFTYISAPMAEKDRQVNPLGFQVLNYTVAEEKPPKGQDESSQSTTGGENQAPVVPAISAVAGQAGPTAPTTTAEPHSATGTVASPPVTAGTPSLPDTNSR